MTAVGEVRDTAAADSPYVGLTFFTQENAPIFFGRDTERTLLISNLRASRLTLLYAESGAGKSSLLRAGVAARLGELAQRSLSQRGTARHIPVVFSSWRNDPTEGLIDEIRESVIPFVPAGLPSGSPDKRLEEVIEAASTAADATLLVMLDQFEEYFLYQSAETHRGRFPDELAACVKRGDLRANFLISIREDAYSGLGDLFKGRIGNVYGNYLRLEHLNRESARLAIEKPIASFNRLHGQQPPVEIEQELIDAVLNQFSPDQFAAGLGGTGRLRDRNGAGGDGIAAPYLQLVMKRLWESELSRGSTRLRLATLTELGGAQTIFQTHVDRALDGLADDDRDAAAEIFRHLITPSGTKIALAAADLADYTGRSPSGISALLERLAGGDTRILRPVSPPPGGEGGPRFEISHDLLAPTIVAWSSEHRARRLENEKKAAERQAQAERGRARRFRALAAGAATLLALAVCLLVVMIIAISAAHKAGREAKTQRNIAISAQVAGESEALARHEPFIAPLLAVAAWRIAPTFRASASLLNILAQPDRCVLLARHEGYAPLYSVAFSSDGKDLVTAGPGDTAWAWDVQACHLDYTFTFPGTAVDSVARSPDGKTLAVALADGTAQLWDMATHKQDGNPLDAGPGRVTGVAFTRDGKTLATADAGGGARLWNVATHRLIGAPLDAGPDGVTGVAFTRDGKILATAGTDGTVGLWRVPAGRRIRGFKASRTGAVYSVAFSPDGRTLATAGADGTAGLWKVAPTGPETGARLQVSDSAVRSVAFSPDGTTLATGGADGITRLWKVATREQVGGAPLTVGAIPVYSVAFSPDGKTLATADAAGTARLWNPAVYHQIALGFTAGRAPAYSAAFSRDGKILATAGTDGTVGLWRVPAGRRIRGFKASRTGAVYSVAFSRDGKILATGGADGTARLWDVATGLEKGAPLQVSAGAVRSVAFSPDGRFLATADADGTARLWDVATGLEKGAPLQVSDSAVRSVAFSPDGTTLATASADGTAQLWDVATQRRTGDPFLSYLPLESAAFDPSGKVLATASDDGSVRLWRDTVLTRSKASRSIRTALPVSTPMYSVVFNPHGRTLATASGDGKARLWDVATHQQIGAALAAGPGPVTGVAFSPDGKTLATASPGGGTRLWNVFLPHDPVGHVCAIAHKGMTPRQWRHYVPVSEPFRPVCQR